jgi:hypothetical protein
MPIARITVTSVSDEGDQVIVRGAQGDGAPVAFVFQAKGDDGDPGMAERASRLRAGDRAVIDCAVVADGWYRAKGLSLG